MTDKNYALLRPDDMLPCPFCGSVGEVEHSGTDYHPGCSNDQCIAYMMHDHFARCAEAIAAWNKRAE